MKLPPLIGMLALGAMPVLVHGTEWPTTITFDNGVKAKATGIFQYDLNRFGNDRLPDGSRLFSNADGWRRQEVDLSIEKQGAFEIAAGYDFEAQAWTDTYVALETSAGKFQMGEFRTPVGWESARTSSANTTFMEAGLPVAAVYEGRRAGLGWTYAGVRHWTLQAAWFAPHDLNHDGDGSTVAARAVYAPVLRNTKVVHLGLAASRESRDGGQAQLQTPPEVFLTPVRLVDTGMLEDVGHIHRAGLEAGWMQGPLLLQGEYLAARITRDTEHDIDARGYYASAGWILTGESRTYDQTAFGPPEPSHGWGALELAVRYSTVELDDGLSRAGNEHDWTLGLNWYIGEHFKLQANYVRAQSGRGNLDVNPRIYGLRAQMTF